MMLGKDLGGYDTNPQQVKAGKMLEEQGFEVKEGDIISYVITRDGVKPVQMASKKDVDINKYEEHLESPIEQILDALDMNFDELVDALGRQDCRLSSQGKAKRLYLLCNHILRSI